MQVTSVDNMIYTFYICYLVIFHSFIQKPI